MKNRHTILALFSALLFFTASCKKENTSATTEQQTSTDISYSSDPAQKMDAYLPAGRTTEKTKVLILVHGGSWISGDKSDLNQAVTLLRAQLGDYAIFNINYRLASTNGTNLWPAQDDDVAAAIRYIIEKRTEFQCNTNKIVLIGVSAGAHLAMLQAYKNNTNGNIKAVVDFFGPTDIADLYSFYSNAPTYQSALTLWLGGTPTGNATAYTNASPIKHVSAQAPPTIIFHGTADDIVPIRQSQQLNTALTAAGVVNSYTEYAGEGHGLTGTSLIDSYSKAIAFIQKQVP